MAPAATLTELASVHDLNAGDLIATGTPAGCAARAPGKLTMFIFRHLLSEATKWRLFIAQGAEEPGVPATRRPHQRLDPHRRRRDRSGRADDGHHHGLTGARVSSMAADERDRLFARAVWNGSHGPATACRSTPTC